VQNTKSKELTGSKAEAIRKAVKSWVSEEVNQNLEQLRITHLWADRYRLDWFCLTDDPTITVKQRRILDSRFVRAIDKGDGTFKLEDKTK